MPEREALRERVEALRNDARSPDGAGRREARALIAGLYGSRAFEPLWADAARVVALRRAIAASAAHGLDPRDYHAQALAAALPPADARARAERELLLDDAERWSVNSGTGTAVKLGSTTWMPVLPVRLDRWNSSTQPS